ncbi:hypothetical protein F4775DRAFT_593955 [Biscogniauxia sp. FL1348]|nr:hypothetical protein F4775DRAFT_593955 [Biscogniauxia sp. FL1348]
MSQVTLSFRPVAGSVEYAADRSLGIDDGEVEVLTWNATENINHGLPSPCDQESPEAVFVKTGIAKAKRALLSDKVTSAMKAVIKHCCADEHFGSCVQTDPGRIVGRFVHEIMRRKVLVGVRRPADMLDAGTLADVDLDTGIIWFNRGYMRKTRRGGVANARSENHLYMAIVVPALHGWSRRLARRITQGHFRDPDHFPATTTITPQLLKHRLYTFSDDRAENAAWLAEAFGDYVVDVLFGGEFAVYMRDTSPWHPAEFPVVCRNPCHEPPQGREFRRIKWDVVNMICETPADWPQFRGKRKAHTPGRFAHDDPQYRLVGELATVRRRRAGAPAQSQQMVDRACERERGEGGSGWDWARELFPDCEIPGLGVWEPEEIKTGRCDVETGKPTNDHGNRDPSKSGGTESHKNTNASDGAEDAFMNTFATLILTDLVGGARPGHYVLPADPRDKSAFREDMRWNYLIQPGGQQICLPTLNLSSSWCLWRAIAYDASSRYILQNALVQVSFVYCRAPQAKRNLRPPCPQRPSEIPALLGTTARAFAKPFTFVSDPQMRIPNRSFPRQSYSYYYRPATTTTTTTTPNTPSSSDSETAPEYRQLSRSRRRRRG